MCCWSGQAAQILKLIDGSLESVVFTRGVTGRERPESWALARTNSSVNGRLHFSMALLVITVDPPGWHGIRGGYLHFGVARFDWFVQFCWRLVGSSLPPEFPAVTILV